MRPPPGCATIGGGSLGAEGMSSQGSLFVLNAHQEIILEPSKSSLTLFPSSPIFNLWPLYSHLPEEETELVRDMSELTRVQAVKEGFEPLSEERLGQHTSQLVTCDDLTGGAAARTLSPA